MNKVNINQKEYKKLTPFKLHCLNNFPFIDADFDALNNWELLCKIVEYLNNVIYNEKNLEDNQTSLYNFVKNYFDDLDITTEINNKLDEMAQSGELTEIIAQYLRLAGVLAYNNIEDLKNAENLSNGSTVRTLGYHTYQDGGGAYYKVRNIINTDVPDDVTIIALHDVNLVAELLYNNINVKQFGAYGDGVHDDTESIQKAISLLRINPRVENEKDYSEIYFPNGNYLVSDTLNFINTRWSKIYGKATITSNINKPIINLIGAMYLDFYDLILVNNNTSSNAVVLNINESYVISFNNCFVKGGDKVVNIVSGNDLIFNTCFIRNGRIGVYTESNTNNTSNVFINCQIEDASEYAVYLGYNRPYYGIYSFKNCYIECSSSKAVIYVKNKMYSLFENCYINQRVTNHYLIELDGTITNMNVFIKGCQLIGTSGNVYALKFSTENIKVGARIDNTNDFDSSVTLYNNADTYKAYFLLLNPEKLDIYNLTWLKDTGGVLDTWLGTGTYTLKDSMTADSLKSLSLSRGYIYKPLYLDADTVYEIKATAKNTGSGSCRIEIFDESLTSRKARIDSSSTTPTEITLYYKPTTSAVYTLLIRNESTTSADYSGIKIFAHKVK